MHRKLSSNLAASIGFALLLLGNPSFAEPPKLQSAEHNLLETGSAQSQYLYDAGLLPSSAPKAEPAIVQKLHVEWVTPHNQPARLDQLPGLRF